VKELSLYGRYLDTPPPLPVRTGVKVNIYGRGDFSEAAAKVLYANAGDGPGIPGGSADVHGGASLVVTRGDGAGSFRDRRPIQSAGYGAQTEGA
jgi:hypothetical protein